MTMNPLYVPDSHLRLIPRPDGTVSVSLSEHLAALLGPLQWTECHVEPGSELVPGVPFASVETSKTACEVALPFPALFVAANPRALADAAILSRPADPDGWLCVVRPADENWRDGLLDGPAYAAYVAP